MKPRRSYITTDLPEVPDGTTRRLFLLATAAVSTGMGTMAAPPDVLAQQPAATALDDAEFLRLSKATIGHDDLDTIIASRLFAALRHADPAFNDHAVGLTRLIHGGQTPEALLDAAKAIGLHETMLTLVAAWYTGTVGHGQQAEIVSYADALMYRPVSDGLPVPTYCLDGPLWWPGPPPPAGVSAPTPTAAAPPPPPPTPAETPKGG
jgi:fructose 5-dehydrogenase small subunit